MNPKQSTQTDFYQLTCRMDSELAALERLCQVVRIRGFRISSMAVETVGDTLNIALTVRGSRAIAMLQSQLEKLQTVASVELIEQVDLIGKAASARTA